MTLTPIDPGAGGTTGAGSGQVGGNRLVPAARSRSRAPTSSPEPGIPEPGADGGRPSAPGQAPRTPAAGMGASPKSAAGLHATVTRLASIPPWPAPPAPADVLLQIRLGLPPVTESRARISPAEYTVIGGKRVKTRKAHGYKLKALEDYQVTVGWLLRRARVTRNDTDQLGVYGVFHLPEGAGAADGDNLLKAIVDAGNGICWKDDRQFVTWMAHVVRGSSDPHTDLVVYVTGFRAGAA